VAEQTQKNLGNDAECSFGTDHHLFQVVSSHVFFGFAACPKNFSIGKHRFQTENVIFGDAVFQTAKAA
jgi:hypothetical protein